jgi:hypothetical protein
MARSDFFGLPVATLEELRDEYVAAIKAVAVNGVSYSIGGRSLSRANLTEMRNTLGDVMTALDRASGRRRRTVLADFSGVRS